MAIECTLGSGRSFVTLTVLARQFPEHRDFEDGNWLHASATVRAGGMTADVQHEFVRAEECSEFLVDLERMEERSRGDARFSTLEGWLDMKLHRSSDGSLIVKGNVLDRHGTGSRLRFSLPELDTTHLAALIASLQRAVEAFPVVGRPEVRQEGD